MASNNNNFDLEPDNVSKVKEMKFGIVVSNWNKNITNNLFDGAYKTLIKYGVKEANIKKIEVPGSFELVYGCKRMQNKNVDAVIAIGCIIKGETDHYDYICSSVSSGITQLNIINDIPIVFCVLTDHNIDQSINRSGGKHGNKGIESAVAAIKMACIK
ncbi:MAG TPA: 6,7-dimethyl-8-ribityllumazine synthase [Flavobacteriaceae bacterium]|nr:6,7-dimethyl-8-ribityllumazine synthase [Flavobacteriaceae bacterium]